MLTDKIKYRRLFIALNIPEETKEKLLELRDSIPLKAEYRWEPKEKLHITISFLGNVDEQKIPLIENVLDEVAMFNKFICLVTNFASFGVPGTPRVFYAKLVSDQILFRIEKYFSECLENLDILTDEKQFKPHITLLKGKETVDEEFVKTFSSFRFRTFFFQAAEVALFESVLGPLGSTYKQLKTIYLS